MSARRHRPQEQQSQGPANNFEDSIDSFMLAAKVLLESKQWNAHIPMSTTCAGKVDGQNVQTVRTIPIAGNTIHPKAKGQQRQISTNNLFACLKQGSLICRQVGDISKVVQVCPLQNCVDNLVG